MGGLRFKVHTQGLAALKKRMQRNASFAECEVANAVAQNTVPFVPARNLVLTERTQVFKNFIIYPDPYAHYLYRGILYVNPVNGSSWVRKGKRKVPTSKPLKISRAVHPKAQSKWLEASKKHNLKKWKRVAAKAVKHGK